MTVMSRGFNFGAGPAMLPEEILCEAQNELLNWHGLGLSILEIGHRTSEFTELMTQAETSLRKLLTIPDNYQVLFLGGAARTQFASIPLNFLTKHNQAGYLITGLWSSMAYAEAKRLKNAYCIASSEGSGFTQVPDSSIWKLQDNTAYLYYTPNETVNGVRVAKPPHYDNLPLIADMTSCLLTEPININNYGLIFAGAQKNIANAGLTIVIIRDELLNTIQDSRLPTMMDYRVQTSNHSLYATPPTFNCYLALKMFHWIERQGGVDSLYRINCEKAARLYKYIDLSTAYLAKVEPEARSLVNVCFTLLKPELEPLFLEQATQNGLLALQGHRTAGGLRASIYNSMPMEGVERLINFMDDFARKHAI